MNRPQRLIVGRKYNNATGKAEARIYNHCKFLVYMIRIILVYSDLIKSNLSKLARADMSSLKTNLNSIEKINCYFEHTLTLYFAWANHIFQYSI